ncbi:Segregation and condensation protein B [Mesoplasma sp. JKS002658]|uniref:SMC-Scp complex subunit ScpB n=1 Tax=Mesoplasma whartonense TaxID=2878854 RepID=UPI002022A1B1|nr:MULTISPECIES: SMC-Scp complex subunit ScpB [unclassified Mesoplasma]MCL8211290.1 Segregation and condensation protein B [Mesoplasma sp. JKS002664]MCL8212143.1 Segregation and condensation protein B [Mesoplasma sp. JKS002662]MCL8212593.1 Segregation and condensation protein B [Mesoplasma sp. JKS002661]MCL8213285.1 Segregation and condensation protein B [Mesoplasma sp. JKS002660]MCL8214328.1 Segregation and condensation protein B [Mesoplasma sp. JKS002658]
MNNQELQAIIEGLLFISGDDGIELGQIAQVLSEEKPSVIKKTIKALEDKYNQDEASIFSIQKFNQNKYRLQTKSKYNNYLARLKTIDQPHRLTPAAIEVLSIIAYDGPISRHEIDLVRKSDSTYQVQRLKEKHLIKVVARDRINRSAFYEVTDNFYKIFNLTNGKADLPSLNFDDSSLEDETLISNDSTGQNIFKGDLNE